MEKSIVHIEWIDSTQPISEWIYLKDREKTGAIKCQSVGFLLNKDNDSYTLAPNVAAMNTEENKQASGIINIPIESVTGMSCLTRVPYRKGMKGLENDEQDEDFDEEEDEEFNEIKPLKKKRCREEDDNF